MIKYVHAVCMRNDEYFFSFYDNYYCAQSLKYNVVSLAWPDHHFLQGAV